MRFNKQYIYAKILAKKSMQNGTNDLNTQQLNEFVRYNLAKSLEAVRIFRYFPGWVVASLRIDTIDFVVLTTILCQSRGHQKYQN